MMTKYVGYLYVY